MLAIIIARAKEDDQIKGIVPHLLEDGLSILQYADDTIIFMDHDIEQAKNMKLLLCTFSANEQYFSFTPNQPWLISQTSLNEQNNYSESQRG